MRFALAAARRGSVARILNQVSFEPPPRFFVVAGLEVEAWALRVLAERSCRTELVDFDVLVFISLAITRGLGSRSFTYQFVSQAETVYREKLGQRNAWLAASIDSL